MPSSTMSWLMLACALLLCGCPAGEPESSAPAATAGITPAPVAADTTARLTPAQPIPADEPLAQYAGLTLGMSSVELAQVYPAPEGRGEGYSRIIEDYGDVQHHIIAFTVAAGQPERRLVASLYRDQLYLIIDRRDGVNGAQIAAWREECFAAYGKECVETINGAQWSWPGQDGVNLAFTQDNSAPDYMDAHIIVAHQPTQAAAHAYLELREQHAQEAAQPQGSTPR